MENSGIINDYNSNGYVISESLLNENQIISLRNELDQEFINHNTQKSVSRLIFDFKSSELIKKIIMLYTSDFIKKIILKFRDAYQQPISILPIIEVHKNYHINLKDTLGWHRDCGGEMDYNYCKNILYKKDYLFSKVGIYLQNNGEYGGSIDIIKKSHKSFSKSKVLIRKIKNIPLRIVSNLHNFLKNIYLMLPESLFMFLLNGKKLNPQKGSAVFFDSRLIHRGSPISKKNLGNVNYLKGKHGAILPKAYDKYSLYCHLGTTEAVDSYMFDRLKREGNGDELKKWDKQIKLIATYDRSFSEEINLVFDPIRKKYKDFL